MKISSKGRSYLRSLASKEQATFNLGKAGLTPEFTAAVAEMLAVRELIKINVLNNCAEEPKEVATVLAERTRSICVQVIGRKIVLYRQAKEPKIIIPE